MQYVKVKDNVVIHIVDTTNYKELYKECNNEGCLNEGNWMTDNPMPNNNQVNIGDDIRKFDSNWKLRPLQDLVDEGLLSLNAAEENDPEPTGTLLEKIENNKIVPKTFYDFVKEGVFELETMQYLCDETETVKNAESYDKLVEVGKYTEEEVLEFKKQDSRDKRDSLLAELDVVVLNPLRWDSFTDEQKQEIATYRQDLLDVPQQEDFPTDIVWPIKPDFI